MRQVVTNLLDNACKYTPAFGRVRLSLERVADAAVFIVEDNGIGIPAERIPHVFDLFTRSDNDGDPSIRGLGVGLALVRKIAELHGGEVQARSLGAGCGSVFVVRLPVCPTSLLVSAP